MVFSEDVLSIMVLASLGLSVVAVALILPRALRRRRPPAQIPEDQRLQVVVEGQGKAIERLERAARQLAVGERRLGELAEVALRHVGVVRFDAFEDMGGRLSFSAAFLDSHGDGLVITSINGRQDTRCYAKAIQRGTSPHHLSDEERQAIREALEGPRRIVEAS